MDERYKYKWGEHGLLPDIKHLAQVAVKHLTTQPLSTHGDHFAGRHQIILPTTRDEFPEFYGEVVDQRTGPDFYDRQGYPIDMHQAFIMNQVMGEYRGEA
jgi:hypothetical protein